MKLTSFQITNYKSFQNTGHIDLSDVTLLVGRNNSGKSAIISALMSIQESSEITGSFIRKGENEARIVYRFDELDIERRTTFLHGGPNVHDNILEQSIAGPTGTLIPKSYLRNGENMHEIRRTTNVEPNNIFYPFLAKRKVVAFQQQTNKASTDTVVNNLQYLHAKIARLSNPRNPKAKEYEQLCIDVLGFHVTTYASEGGQQAGIPIGNTDYIPIEHMGEGVPNILGLITDLCIADGQIFLIEELENDIHPLGLKSLLKVISEKSKVNQFIISTHSNIVVKWLGVLESSKIFNISLELKDAEIPLSNISEVGSDIESRTKVLEDLGYELYDYDLWDGWLILEESTAERFIRDVLIPRYAPRLSRLRTLAVGGTSKAEPTFEDFRRLFLFSNLEPKYKNKSWVVLDGDDDGKKVIDNLKKKYSGWNKDNFRYFENINFETYYPSLFSEKVAELETMSKDDKRLSKAQLIEEVVKWADATDSKEVEAALEESAIEVINMLKDIDTHLFSQ